MKGKAKPTLYAKSMQGTTKTLHSYEASFAGPVVIPNFPLSKGRLSRKDIVCSEEQAVYVRIREKMVLSCAFCPPNVGSSAELTST